MHPLIEQYLVHLSLEKGLSHRTIEAYSSDLAHYAALSAPVDVEAADTARIYKYSIELRNAGLGVATRRRRLACLRGFYRFLLKEKIIDHNPAARVVLPRHTPPPPPLLSPDQVQKLLNAPSATHLLQARDRVMLLLTYAAALRVSELLALNCSDVDLQSGFVRVSSQAEYQRAIPLEAEIVTCLGTYLNDIRPRLLHQIHSPCLFAGRAGRPMTRQGFWKLFKRYASISGITEPLSPHSLRHARAAHLVATGVDIQTLQRMLGHADISSTQIYLQAPATDLAAMHRRFHARGS